jgi:hypothetical protein
MSHRLPISVERVNETSIRPEWLVVDIRSSRRLAIGRFRRNIGGLSEDRVDVA